MVTAAVKLKDACSLEEKLWQTYQFSSVAQSCPTLCNPLNRSWPPCPSPTPRVYPNSRPLSHWCHPTISSSAIPSSCTQSFLALESFPMSQLFISGSHSIGASASTSVLPMNTQGWSPLGLTGLILQSKGLSRVFSSTIRKHQFFSAQPSSWSSFHIRTWLLEKPQVWLYGSLSTKRSLHFNMLSRLP